MGLKAFCQKLWPRRVSESVTTQVQEKASSVFADLAMAYSPRKIGRMRVKDAFVLDLDGPEQVRPVDTVALYLQGRKAIVIRDRTTGNAGPTIRWAETGVCVPVFCDWEGMGHDSLVLYDQEHAAFHLFPEYGSQKPAVSFHFGPPGLGWIPLAGDWNGDGVDGIGLYDPASGVFVLRNELNAGPPDIQCAYGPAGQGWMPIVGDWNGDQRDEVGVYHPMSGTFLLSRNLASEETSAFHVQVSNIREHWQPIAGDWAGDGRDSVGLYDPEEHVFYLIDSSSGKIGHVFKFGATGETVLPLALKWKADDGSS